MLTKQVKVKQACTLFGATCLAVCYAVSAWTQPAVDWNDMNLTGHFRMEPKLDLCEAGVTCNDSIYEGEIKVVASRSESGRLTKFDATINDELLPLDVVERYGEIDEFRLNDFSVRIPSRYVPGVVSERFVGGLGPIMQLLGLSYVDEGCDSQIRNVDILYDFELDEVEVFDWCDMP